jgi:transcriptional regulator with XRE-family HTH domain
MLYLNTIMENKFGKLLKFYRERTNKTLYFVAEKIKKTKSYLSQVESGRAFPPGYEICAKLVKLFKLTDNEKLEFMAAAVTGRQQERDKPFYDELGAQYFEKLTKRSLITELKGNTIIPVFEYPKKKIVPPYNEMETISHINISEIISSNGYYGIFYNKEAHTESVGFSSQDLLIIDPLQELTQDGDIVLVRINNKVVVRKIDILKTSDSAFIQFTPHLAEAMDLFDLKKDINKKYEIFGKVVLAIKKT